MRFLEFSNSAFFLTAATLLLSHVSSATPTCSNITDVTYDLDTPFGNTSTTRNTSLSYQELDRIICPSDNPGPCTFDKGKTYNLTANRYLSFSNLSSVISTEAEKIYDLSQNAWQAGYNGTVDPFITRTAVLYASTLDKTMLEVKPGMNMSLGFNVFFKRTKGTLGGCANETLNGVRFEALVPYLDTVPNLVETSQGQKKDVNGKVLAGNWQAMGGNANVPISTAPTAVPDKKNSGNMGLGGGQVMRTCLALLVVMFGFGML